MSGYDEVGRHPAAAPCEICQVPTPTAQLTGQWVAGAVVGPGFIGREMVVKRLVFVCPACPSVGDPS